MQVRVQHLFLVVVSVLLVPIFSAQAGLLGKLIEGAPKRVELTTTSDKSLAFKDAFTPKGAFAKSPSPVNSSSKKLVVAGFQVEFATEQKGISHGNGVDAGLASTTDKVYTLKGVTDEQMQAVTDKLYAIYIEKMQSRGYEVLPPSVLVDTGYKEFMAKANQPPVHHERGSAMDLIFGTREKEVDNASVIVTAKDTSPAVFTSMTFGWGAGQKAADVLQANIVHLRLKVNFAKFEESGWFSPGLDDKPQNTIGTSGTSLQVFSPGGKQVNLPLVNTIILPSKLAEVATPVSASAGQTTNRAAGGAMRALTGLLTGDVVNVAAGATASAHSVMASGNYEVQADSTYEDVVSKDLNLALDLMVEAFNSVGK